MDPHLLASSLWWLALGTTILLVCYYALCNPAVPGFNGPKGIPVLGSFLFLNLYPELTLHRWARKYGKIYSFRLGNQSFLLVPDPVIVKGAIFSSRKNMFTKAQTILKGRAITGSPYGDIWRKKFEATMNFEPWTYGEDVVPSQQGGTRVVNPQARLIVIKCYPGPHP